MTYEEFLDKYEPLQNTMEDSSAFNGLMFETYGEELERVEQAVFDRGIESVCTIIEVEGDFYVVEGFQFVNRYGYFILSQPCHEELNVLID